jgi:hypothetical protein
MMTILKPELKRTYKKSGNLFQLITISIIPPEIFFDVCGAF